MASFEHIAQRLVTSVPSIGGSKAQTLEAALARVARAETELATARAEARRLGRAAGKKLNTLFEDSTFVRRSSSKSWIEETRSEAYTAGFEKACYYFERALRPQSEKERDPFYRIAAGLVRKGLPRLDPTDEPVSEIDQIQEQIRAAQRPDLSGNRLINAPDNPTALSEAIHAAAEKARTPTGRHKDDTAPMKSLSAEILKQGRRRRGEEQ